jgi:hypothetical protein
MTKAEGDAMALITEALDRSLRVRSSIGDRPTMSYPAAAAVWTLGSQRLLALMEELVADRDDHLCVLEALSELAAGFVELWAFTLGADPMELLGLVGVSLCLSEAG